MCLQCLNNILVDPVAIANYSEFEKHSSALRDKIWNDEIAAADLDLNTVELSFKQYFKNLTTALQWDDIKPGSPRYKRLMALQHNIYTFSALKNYDFLKQMELVRGQMSLDKKTFDQEWESGHNFYYNLHQDVEANHVWSVGNAIKEWENVLEHADTMPYLTYQTAGDERVREKHRLLDDLTFRYDDPIWKRIYPPNGYHCRCRVGQDFEGKVSKTDYDKLPAPDKGFDINWGEHDFAFRSDHPYMKVNIDRNPELKKSYTDIAIKLKINQ